MGCVSNKYCDDTIHSENISDSDATYHTHTLGDLPPPNFSGSSEGLGQRTSPQLDTFEGLKQTFLATLVTITTMPIPTTETHNPLKMPSAKGPPFVSSWHISPKFKEIEHLKSVHSGAVAFVPGDSRLQCGSDVAYIYFVSFIFLCSYLVSYYSRTEFGFKHAKNERCMIYLIFSEHV